MVELRPPRRGNEPTTDPGIAGSGAAAPAAAGASPANPARSAASPEPGANSSAPVKMVEVINFKFMADRFGFAANVQSGFGSSEVEYARGVLRALNRWAETIASLLGDVDQALRAAGDARILPYYPTWSSTLESRQLVQTSLGSEAEARAVRQPGSSAHEIIVDQRTRDAVDELRIYLRML